MITPVNCQSPVTGSHPISPSIPLLPFLRPAARSIIRSSSHLKAHNLPARPPRSAHCLLDLPTGVIAARIPLLPAMVVEDDEPFQTPSPSTSPSLSQSPPPPPISVVDPSAAPPLITHPSDSVTVAAAAPLHQTLTLALPIQPPPGSAAFGGNGREDCWSEGATSTLIDAWGERFVELSRGSLKQKHWQEVADVVSSRDDYSKTPRTDAQCKNRIDTLKKKYKLEKAKIAGPGSSAASCWPFFNRLDALLGNIVKPSPSAPKHPSPASVATVARSQFPQKQRTSLPFKRKAYTSPQAASASSTSDSFPPEAIPPPAANGQKGLPAARTRELTRAILKFGEVYQRVESSKLQQAIEMERQRMGFRRELEMQRMQFFMKTQMELSQLRHRPSSARAGDGHGGGGSSSNQHHSRHHYHQTPRHNNNNGIENSG